MDLFNGMDIGVYSSFRVLSLKSPELAEVMRGSATVGAYLWIGFLALLVWRWWSATGRFPTRNLLTTLALIAAVEGLRLLLNRARPDDAQDFFGHLAGGSFPNGPVFRATLISALMWETTAPGWSRRLGLLGAVLYCAWVAMGQLMVHLGFLTDILASLSLALGIGFLAPRIFAVRSAANADAFPPEGLHTEAQGYAARHGQKY